MTEFAEWFTDRMAEISFVKTYSIEINGSVWLSYLNKEDVKGFHVCYVFEPIETDEIRKLFESHNGPIMFVVSNHLLPSFNSIPIPDWVRVLHAIYYGRVYTWFGGSVRALHYDWQNNHTQLSEKVDITGILFIRTDCQLRDFPGTFDIARFYDRAFWKEQSKPPPKKETWKERAKKQREEWEQATNGHAEKDYKKQQYQQDNESAHNRRHSDEDVYEAFKRAFREHMHSYGVDYDTPRSQPYNAPSGDKWLSVLIATGSLEAARTKYKQLAKQYHPDLNPGDSEALETMKAINIAYERVEEYWR